MENIFITMQKRRINTWLMFGLNLNFFRTKTSIRLKEQK